MRDNTRAYTCTHPSNAVIQVSTDVNGNTEERRATLLRQIRKASQKSMSLENHTATCHMKNREGKAFLAGSMKVHSVPGELLI